MRAILLAAGQGTRLGKYGKALPKGLVEVGGKSLVERQMEAFRRAGIERLVIVTGYRAEQFSFRDVTYYRNDRYATTNMVASLMCARKEFRGDVIVSYGDILFEDRVLKDLLRAQGDIVVTVDTAWRRYWRLRYRDECFDTEGLKIGSEGNILRIGEPEAPPEEIDARYVGLLKFSTMGTEVVKRVYDAAKGAYAGKPWQTARTFDMGYMTDLLQEIIDAGHPVRAMKIENGWLELDTEQDYEKLREWSDTGGLSTVFSSPL